ncbi:HAMP domain-containing histidine kinase [Flavihumibacter sp. R14]|nr:HAMP domain-containing histidine kinase [Flavihumibacter soli]
MIKLITISLENEMDLVLTNKRSMKVAEMLGLTLSTQTTFTTAVSEIARTVIEHTDNGKLTMGLEQNKIRYNLVATVSFDSNVQFTNEDEGFYYAQKLIPEFTLTTTAEGNLIVMKMGLPRSLNLNIYRISDIKRAFEEAAPLNAYEEIKLRNIRLNQKAAEQEEELQRSKLIDEKKTEFISVASHEIKTPITVLKAYTQIALGMKEHCNDHMRGMLTKIDVQTNKLLSLVQQLLDVSRIENGSLQYDKKALDLNNFIEEMTGLLRNILPDHQVTASYCEPVSVMIDSLRMEQVFSNLIGNAAKYSQKKSTIHIQCKLNEEGFAQVAIIDEGIGMTTSSIKSIFNKFYRDKDVIKTHSGLGMGLYITSKIITDHGGKIWVESTEGSGSTFFFTLPPYLEPVRQL